MAIRTEIDEGKLEKLITCCEDGHLGYKQAADGVTDPGLRAEFQQQSAERLQFRQQLNALNPNTADEVEGSWQGKVHRGWINMKEGINVSDEEIIKDVLTGEKQALDQYEEALDDSDINPQFAQVAAAQREAIAAQRARLEARAD